MPGSEASDRCPSGECQCGNRTEDSHEPHEAILHRSTLPLTLAYQPLMALIGSTLVPPSRPPCPDVPRNMETDLTRKSVGCTIRSASTLSAQFRWWHQRVRAFIDAQYLSTRCGPDYRGAVPHRSIRN